MSEGRRPDSISSDDLAAILESAVLAPSSHNTQPWRFEVSESGVSLFADRLRALPVNDPDDRELTISCGCALFNLRIAAAHAGFAASCELLPSPEEEDLLARVSFKRFTGSEDHEAELFQAIARRRTYRKRFEPKPVPASVLDALAEAAEAEGAWFQVLESEPDRQQVAELVAEGDASQWSNPSWRRELAAWMHPRRKGDGLTVPGMIAPVAQLVVRTFDMGNGVGAKDRQLADESPVIAALGTSGDGMADWLQAGQALARVLLTSLGQGLQASYLNQPIQVAVLRPKLQHLLGRSGFPQILLRLGYPATDLPAVPRRNLQEVVEAPGNGDSKTQQFKRR
ncbi:Acg family FMN-binding oxidoreductase [Marinobacter subterrani]|uniref:Nitroreductase n=1 Tax=Marinobacter subterrani TaxID=1658765 RepID=A0A0J7M235_9GAMM|nr:nitroreductase family protein [Marinobacter subterrani]KMQ75095.1 Nitroreductase [Marinobacter subterrani]